MKLSLFYRTILLMVIIISSPALLIAGGNVAGNKMIDQTINENADLFVSSDSIPRQKGQAKKSQDRKPEDNRGSSGNKPKPAIKEVPRSIPKLGPKAVKDRIPIKRLPPKKGIRINRLII